MNIINKYINSYQSHHSIIDIGRAINVVDQTLKYFKAIINTIIKWEHKSYNNNYKTICNGIRYLFIVVDMQVIE